MRIRVSPSVSCDNKIKAIKAVRSLSGGALKEMKDFIERGMVGETQMLTIDDSDPVRMKEDIQSLTMEGFGISILDEGNDQARANMLELIKDMVHDCVDQNLFELSRDLTAVLERNYEEEE